MPLLFLDLREVRLLSLQMLPSGTKHAYSLTRALGAVDPDTITPDANGNYPPIIHYAGLPTENLVGSINGLLSGVLAYAGVQLYVEFLAEMRRPRDFLKVFIQQ